ncbi:putative formin-like protein 5 [Iris pallida]|uniref:Formin-like protein 5 n=1 Tax=Iris pallida TaxID=29817 RepID=A0AAX6FCD4_IRIPA|nr:putative formin-like protein 5 [Iris pallida]
MATLTAAMAHALDYAGSGATDEHKGGWRPGSAARGYYDSRGRWSLVWGSTGDGSAGGAHDQAPIQ